MAGESFIERPTELYREWLSRTGSIREDVGFEEGRMAMALEVITVRKSLAAVGMLTAGTISVLESLLVDQGMLDKAESLYDELAEWRRLKVERVSDDEAQPRARQGTLGSPTSQPLRHGKDPSP